MNLTQEELKEVMHYDPETGVFTWTKPTCTWIRPGAAAGCKYKRHYVLIRYKDVSYRAHRLVFLYMTGCVPREVYALDGDRTNTKWANLTACRIGKPRTRLMSRKCFVTGRGDVVGVRFSKHKNKWVARISIKGLQKHLGGFNTQKEAVAARRAAERSKRAQNLY